MEFRLKHGSSHLQVTAVTNAKNGIVTVIDDGVVSKVYYFKQSKIEQI